MKADLIIPTYRPDDTFCLLLQKLQERADSTAAVNAGRNWSTEEEAQLLQEYGMGLPIETIARRHGRSVGAIETRLSELGQRDQIQFSMR